MIVAKSGNSLAIRIPSSVVDALELKEGDEVDVRVGNDRALEIGKDDRRQKAIEKIKSFKIKLPADWKFNRDEANSP
jgi:antitoxin MazE